ncbi:endonuclease III domain-containing protein [Candidatus Woesearchaeota archaeon]|nr:endonuclease III domain-containing protein [Candidatus Woesearchaeota archaeon]
MYGPQGWWPVNGKYNKGNYSIPRNSEERFEICCGAILTQNTSWRQAAKAVESLRKLKLLSPKAILAAKEKRIAAAIKPAGYFNQKAKKLRAFAAFCYSLKGKPTREELLSVWGIGKETADSILLYAYKVPTFVVDAYTKRILLNLKLIKKDASYEEIKEFFEKSVKKDFKIYNEYHALLVEHAKRHYRKKEDYKKDLLLSL